LIGNVVECLLCFPEQFDQYFYEVGKTPEGKGADVIKYLHENNLDLYNLPEDIIEDLKVQHDYYAKMRSDKWKEKILELSDYYDSLKSAEGKTAVPKDLLDKCDKKVRSLDPKLLDEIFLEAEFQVPIIFQYQGIECKALLDVVGRKWYDIKTTSKPFREFPKSLLRNGYHIQGYFYDQAIKSLGYDIEFGGYYVIPMGIEPAVLVEWDLNYGKAETDRLIERWKWHNENQIFVNKDLHLSNYKMYLKFD